MPEAASSNPDGASAVDDRLPAPKTVSCEVEIEVLGNEVEGSSSGGGSSIEPHQKRAWQDACALLEKASQRDCEERDRLSIWKLTHAQITNGVKSFSVRIKLRPVILLARGRASGFDDARNACLGAVADACSRAPSGSHCDPSRVTCLQSPDGAQASCIPNRKHTDGAAGFQLVEPADMDPFAE